GWTGSFSSPVAPRRLREAVYTAIAAGQEFIPSVRVFHRADCCAGGRLFGSVSGAEPLWLVKSGLERANPPHAGIWRAGADCPRLLQFLACCAMYTTIANQGRNDHGGIQPGSSVAQNRQRGRPAA